MFNHSGVFLSQWRLERNTVEAFAMHSALRHCYNEDCLACLSEERDSRCWSTVGYGRQGHRRGDRGKLRARCRFAISVNIRLRST